MDPINYKLPQYESIPELKSQGIAQLKKNRKIVLFYNLVIDYTDFQHPGYNDKLDQHMYKQIHDVYHSRNHSFNADLILCHHIVAKNIEASQEQTQKGKSFYNNVKNSDINLRHEALMKKFDFNNPIIQQIQKLTAQQKDFLAQIPKLFKNPQKIQFLESKWQSFVFEQHFWISFCVFWSYFWLMVTWIVKNYETEQIIHSLPLIMIGAVMWTIIEYVFHRFQAHSNIIKNNRLRSHSLHHSFPNLKNKVALQVFKTSASLLLIAIVFACFFQVITVLMIYIGFIGTLVNYDSLHYYCHFGPQINIAWLKNLRIHHLKHHYRDQANDFGVTNLFWDSIFGTNSDKKLAKI